MVEELGERAGLGVELLVKECKLSSSSHFRALALVLVQVLEWVREVIPESGSAVLAGNSVHVDRSFLVLCELPHALCAACHTSQPCGCR